MKLCLKYGLSRFVTRLLGGNLLCSFLCQPSSLLLICTSAGGSNQISTSLWALTGKHLGGTLLSGSLGNGSSFVVNSFLSCNFSLTLTGGTSNLCTQTLTTSNLIPEHLLGRSASQRNWRLIRLGFWNDFWLRLLKSASGSTTHTTNCGSTKECLFVLTHSVFTLE